MLSWRDFSSLLNKGLFVNASFPNLIILSNVKDQIPILSPKLIPSHSGAVGSVSVVGSAHCPHPSRAENEEENRGDRFINWFCAQAFTFSQVSCLCTCFRGSFSILGLVFYGQILNIDLKSAGHDHVG